MLPLIRLFAKHRLFCTKKFEQSHHTKKWWHRKHRNVFFLLVVPAVVAIGVSLLFNMRPKDHELLLVSYNNAIRNGGPVSVIDLRTQKIAKPAIPAMGCDGFARSGDEYFIRLYCQGSQNGNTLWDLNLKNYDANPSPQFPSPYNRMSAFRHPKVLRDNAGREFYSAGGPRVGGGTDARVVIVENGTFTEVPISTTTQEHFIFRMALDESRGKLWLMTIGEIGDTLIDRIDVHAKKVDLSMHLAVYSGWGMLLNDAHLMVTAHRDKEGNDIFVFDAETGVLTRTIALPVKNDAGYNAKSLLISGGRILVSSNEGIFALDRETYAITDFIQNTDGRALTEMVDGETFIYGIRDFEDVVFLPKDTLTPITVLIKGDGAGVMQLFYVRETY